MADQPASQADLQKLENVLEKILRAVSAQSAGVKPSYTNSGSNDPNYKALENVIKNNGSLSNEIQKAMAKLKTGSMELSRAIDVIDADTKHMSDTSRKAAAATIDYIKQTGKVVESLKTLTALKNDVNAFAELPKKIVAINAELQKEIEEKEVIRKKLKAASADEKAAIDEQLKTAYKNIDTLNESLKEANDSVTYLGGTVSSFNDTTKILSEKEVAFIKNVKNLEKDSKEYNRIIEKLMEGTAGLEKGISGTAGSLEHSSSQLEAAAKGFKASLLNAGKLLITSGIPILFKDYLAELKNNVQSSNYIGDAKMGISESERSDFIGNNRTNLRVLGNGSASNGFDKNIQSLQTVARQFGVYGKEGIDMALKYQQQAISQGSSGKNIDAISNRMTFMHNLARQTGETDDALADYMETLNKTGEIQALNSKYANKSEMERQKSVDKEIQQRISLNKAMGVNMEQLAEEERKRQSSTYGGLTDMVRRMVGAKMYTAMQGNLDPSNAYSSKENALMQEAAASGSYLNLSDDKQKAYLAMQNKHGQKSVADRTAAFASGDMGRIARYSIGNQIVEQTGFNQSDYETTGNLRGQTVQGRDGVSVIGTATDEYMNAIDKTKGSLGKLGDAAITAAQLLHGAGQNPAGAAAESLGSGLLSFGGKYLGARFGEAMLKMAAKRIFGGAAADVVATASGDAAATAVGGTSIGTAALTAAPIAGAAAGAASLGYMGYTALKDQQNIKRSIAMDSVQDYPTYRNNDLWDIMHADEKTTRVDKDDKQAAAMQLAMRLLKNSGTSLSGTAGGNLLSAKTREVMSATSFDALGLDGLNTTTPSQTIDASQQTANAAQAAANLTDVVNILENLFGINKEQLDTIKKKNKDDKDTATQEKIAKMSNGSFYKNVFDNIENSINSVSR